MPIHAREEDLAELNESELCQRLAAQTRETYDELISGLPAEVVEQEERRMMLMAVDRHWQEHLAAMDELREGVYLRAQGQKDPLVEFKNEAYELFASLMGSIKEEALRNVFRSAVGIRKFLTQAIQPEQTRPKFLIPKSGTAPTQGRNDPCACGSGRKFKHCCA
jgi:preprotein translocase subunit SecA